MPSDLEVEAAARTMYARSGSGLYWAEEFPWDGASDAVQHEWRDEARAALTAAEAVRAKSSEALLRATHVQREGDPSVTADCGASDTTLAGHP